MARLQLLPMPGAGAGLAQLSGGVGSGVARFGDQLVNLGAALAQKKQQDLVNAQNQALIDLSREQAQQSAAQKEAAARAQVVSNRAFYPDQSKKVDALYGSKGLLALPDAPTKANAALAQMDLAKLPKPKQKADYTLGGGRYDGQTNALIAGIGPQPKAPKAPTSIFNYIADDGYKYAKMSDGSLVKSDKKVKAKASKAPQMIHFAGIGKQEAVPVVDTSDDAGEAAAWMEAHNVPYIRKNGYFLAPKNMVHKFSEDIGDEVAFPKTEQASYLQQLVKMFQD